MDEAPIVYRLNRQDEIISFNEEWLRFARCNGGERLEPHAILNRPIWGFIGDRRTRQLYRDLLRKVRSGHAIRFPFRCDSPDRRRLLQMAMELDHEGEVRMETQPLYIEQRLSVPLLTSNTLRLEDQILQVCGWCKRVEAEKDLWLEVEEAVMHLGLSGKTRSPLLNHSMCETCFERMTSLLDEEKTFR